MSRHPHPIQMPRCSPCMQNPLQHQDPPHLPPTSATHMGPLSMHIVTRPASSTHLANSIYLSHIHLHTTQLKMDTNSNLQPISTHPTLLHPLMDISNLMGTHPTAYPLTVDTNCSTHPNNTPIHHTNTALLVMDTTWIVHQPTDTHPTKEMDQMGPTHQTTHPTPSAKGQLLAASTHLANIHLSSRAMGHMGHTHTATHLTPQAVLIVAMGHLLLAISHIFSRLLKSGMVLS